ncbi:TIGR02206 family membrane protein [Nocardioides caldifontis]|uniref:YwaF family protein n=1 Tax=Nocardioides caldifontis TaxID=2588938 RepID=UPI0011DFCBA9|nr:TIGR02206 family membrane protein [Nocardioides caldifontis]
MTPLAATTRFEAFSGEHLVLLGIFVAGLVVAAAWGRAHRDTPLELPARRTAAVVLAVVALAMQGYQLTPGDFDVDTSLPLALCDLATLMTVVALWTRSPRASAFTYYVGLTLTSQGVLTPSLAEGFPHPRYFGFWALHFLVVWSAAYLTWGLGVRPTWRLYRFTVGATLAWAVVVFLFNVVVDTNYGYLNAKPRSASLLDLLGPWPWYVVAEIAIITVAWALLLTLPWTVAARQRGREVVRT